MKVYDVVFFNFCEISDVVLNAHSGMNLNGNFLTDLGC